MRENKGERGRGHAVDARGLTKRYGPNPAEL
jgi:hypothetical protein